MSVPPAVVVAVSPTTGSPEALRWGEREARLRRRPLRAVMAWRPPRAAAAPGGRATTTLALGADPEEEAERVLANFVQAALGSPDKAERAVVRGAPAKALTHAAEQAELLVLGEPRPGRLGNLRTSLVAPQIVHRVSCPVVVLPAPEADRSHGSPAASRVANAVLNAAGTAGRPGLRTAANQS